MSKRPKKIHDQGHAPKTAAVRSFVECERCPDVRLATNEWRRPCPSSVQIEATPSTEARSEP